MKRKSVALIRAVGSIIALSPAISPASGPSAMALRQDALAVRGDFQKVMIAVNVDKLNNGRVHRK